MENNAGLAAGITVMVKLVTLSKWTCSVRDPRTAWFSKFCWFSGPRFFIFVVLGPVRSEIWKILILVRVGSNFLIFWFKDRTGPNHLILDQSVLVCGSRCLVVINPMPIVIIQTNIALTTVYIHVRCSPIQQHQQGIQKLVLQLKKILVLLNKNIYSKFIDQTNINMFLLYIDQQYINLHPWH